MDQAFKSGEPFNPYRMFTGLFIPEELARWDKISAGAKLAWGRLARYAGGDGDCYPTVKALGVEIGVGERQAQKYISELAEHKLIRRECRFVGRAQTSNTYVFLWHEIFEGEKRPVEGVNDDSPRGVNDRSGEGVNDRSGEGVNDRSPKESQIQESQGQEKRLRLSGHESQKPRFAPGDGEARCKRYPRIKEALADYFDEAGQKRIYPSDREVVDIMHAAKPASEGEMIECLRYLYEERGLRPGTRNGPRHFAWFRKVVGDYFKQVRERDLPPVAATETMDIGNPAFGAEGLQ